MLKGNITELGAWEDEAPDFADDLAWIRLKILERRVRAAYLQLGQQEEWQRYHNALLQTHIRKHKLVSVLQQRDLT